MTEQYVSYVMTDVGRTLAARVLAGETLTFKRFAIGDGIDYDISSYQSKTALVNEVLSVDDLTKEDVDNALVIIKGSFSQASLTKEFYYREIGVFVVDPDDETKELLFAYGNKNDKAELIVPSINSYVIAKDLRCFLTVGKTSNVNIYISEKASASVVNFEESDWDFDENANIYSIYIGEVKESIEVLRTVGTSKTNVPCVSILRTGNNETSLQSLSAFDGCVVCI